MSERKNWGSTVLGWFVVRDEADASAPGTDAGQAAAPPEEPPAPAPPAFTSEPPAATGGQVDYDAVFDAAGIAKEERDLFAKAAGLLASLPAGPDPAAHKGVVEASLKAFGIPIDRIIETGAHEIQTLEAYRVQQAGTVRQFADESQKLIADYEKKIAEIRALLERHIAEQASVQNGCNAKKLDVQKVLEFFGQDAVARVVRESPKLVDPSAPPAGKG
jgi:hypothetical protein